MTGWLQPLFQSRCRFVCLESWCGLLLMLMGLLTLIGWSVALPRLVLPVTGYVPMMPDTALLILFYGLVFYYDAVGLERSRHVRTVLAVMIGVGSLYGLAKTVQFFLSFELPWTSLRVVSPEFMPYFMVRQMSPITGFLLACCGMAIGFKWFGGQRPALVNLASLMGLITLGTGLVILLGYMFSAPLLLRRTLPMALNTAVAFVIMGTGVVMLAGRTAAWIRPLVGPSAEARLLRAILPMIPAVLLVHSFFDLVAKRMKRLNPALELALITLVFIVVTSVIIIKLSQRLFRQAEEARRQAEEALRTSEAKYRGLFAAANNAILVLDNCEIIDCNIRATQLLGASRVELIGQLLLRFTPPQQENGAESEAAAAEKIAAALNGDEPIFEWRFCRPDGMLIDTEVSLNPIEIDGRLVLQVLIRDLSQRRKLEQELRNSEANFRHIFANHSDGVVICDTETEKLIMGNAKACRMLDYTTEELQHLTMADLHPPNDYQQIRAVIKASNKSVFANIEALLKRKDGTLFPAEISGTFLMLGGQCCALGAFRDISARKEGEIKLRQARDAAEVGARSKTEFLATISHEFRTPLNGVIGFTGLLREELEAADPGVNEKLSPYLNKIVQCTDTLTAMMDNLLELSELESGHFRELIEEFYPGRIMKECVAAFEFKAHQKQLEFILAADGLPAVLYGDHRRLKLILFNLIGNAVKFTEHGRIEIRVVNVNAMLHIDVRDTGIGMATVALEKITELFHQEDQSATRRYGGSGLGLAVAARLLRMVGGKFAIESWLGSGTHVAIDFPVYSAAGPNSEKLP